MKASCMKYLLLTLSLLSFELEAQSFADYLSHVNRAELLITEEAYDDALLSYDTAFTHWESPFAIDVHNALQCAVLAGDMDRALAYGRALVLLGCDLNFFYAQERLKLFRTSAQWRVLIDEYANLRNQFAQQCNWPLRAQLEQLNVRDQVLRKQNSTYTFLKDSIFYEDNRIMDEVLKIFEDHGYPEERAIGVFVKRDTLILGDPLHIILLHNYVSNDVYKRGEDVTEQLLAFVAEGKMHPETFANLNDRADDYRMGAGFGHVNFIWKLKDKYYFEKTPQEQLAEQDRLRESLGLDTIAEMKQKLLFQFFKKKGYFDFFMGNPVIAKADFPISVADKYFEECLECH